MAEDLEPLNPDDILVYCALRFDAYQYLEDSGFDVDAGIDAYMETETWDRSDEEKLAIFHILQRCLGKWSLVYEPYHGRYWRIFRQMFFDVVEIPLPEKYRYEQWAGKWDTHFMPRMKEMIESVRKEHESIEYDDNALPDFDGDP